MAGRKRWRPNLAGLCIPDLESQELHVVRVCRQRAQKPCPHRTTHASRSAMTLHPAATATPAHVQASAPSSPASLPPSSHRTQCNRLLVLTLCRRLVGEHIVGADVHRPLLAHDRELAPESRLSPRHFSFLPVRAYLDTYRTVVGRIPVLFSVFQKDPARLAGG